jgi:DUF1680 family protein
MKYADNCWVALTEAEIDNYAGFYIGTNGQKNQLTTKLSPLPGENEQGVKVRFADDIQTPWRVILIGNNPGTLIESEIIQNLNPPCAIADPSWIKPGMSAWDHWWSGDVKMEMPVIKEYIDFASEMGWSYMLIDWQWYGQFNHPEADICKAAPQINLPEILSYAQSKNVRIWLWLYSSDVNRNDAYKKAFPLYKEWGVAGVKIDFMDRDDQEMVNWYHNIIRCAADNHLLVDFHGAYKPDGIIRTYPNMITREGVMGNEYYKFSNRMSPEHNVKLAYTRMLAGGMDYTPGGFNNVTPSAFKQQAPAMLANTRAAELAKFVVYESPYTVVADHPKFILGQPGADFLKIVPTVWDNIKFLGGTPNEYVALAKQSGGRWFIGVLNNSVEKEITIDTKFLPAGKYTVEIWEDAKDAGKNPKNIKKTIQTIEAGKPLKVKLAQAGGYVAVINSVADKWERIPYGNVKVGGEIGRRIDITINNNLKKLDLNKDFLDPFQKKEAGCCEFIGAGMLLDAVARFAAYSGDQEVIAIKDQIVNRLLENQLNDGYIGFFREDQRRWQLWDIHEMSYIITGLVTDYTLFGQKRSLDAAVKSADYILADWQSRPAGLPDFFLLGIDKAMVSLYTLTGEERFREFGENKKPLTWAPGIKTGRSFDMTGHIFGYLAVSEAQLNMYRLTGDIRQTKSATDAMDFFVNHNGLSIIGGAGQEEVFTDDQDGEGEHAETCATAYMLRIYENLLRLNGQSTYGDLMERTVYNALFAAQSPDGRRLRYWTSFEGTREYYGVDNFCCPNNYRRIISELPQMIYYTKPEGGIAVNLYTASSVSTKFSDGIKAEIEQVTDYPNSGSIALQLKLSKSKFFPLALRIPAYAKSASVKVNGTPVNEIIRAGEFFVVERIWKTGDKVEITLPMEFRLIAGRERQSGRVAVMRGPLVYSFSRSANPKVNQNFNFQQVGKITLDRSTLQITADSTVRANGTSCIVGAWTLGFNTKSGPHDFDLKLTEFADPEGVVTYFRLPLYSKEGVVEDELIHILKW